MLVERVTIKQNYAAKKKLPVQFKAHVIEERPAAIYFIIGKEKVWVPKSEILKETPDKYQAILF